jgi:hypothetical protein
MSPVSLFIAIFLFIYFFLSINWLYIIYFSSINWQNYEKAISFSVVDFQKENMFFPRALRARVLSYALGAYNFFKEGIVVQTSKKSSFDWKFKGLVSILIVESDWSATIPPTPTIPPNTSNKYFV